MSAGETRPSILGAPRRSCRPLFARVELGGRDPVVAASRRVALFDPRVVPTGRNVNRGSKIPTPSPSIPSIHPSRLAGSLVPGWQARHSGRLVSPRMPDRFREPPPGRTRRRRRTGRKRAITRNRIPDGACWLCAMEVGRFRRGRKHTTRARHPTLRESDHWCPNSWVLSANPSKQGLHAARRSDIHHRAILALVATSPFFQRPEGRRSLPDHEICLGGGIESPPTKARKPVRWRGSATPPDF